MIFGPSHNEVKCLNSISPSQYCSAKDCAYKLVLAQSLGGKHLLPTRANGHVGSIIHKMIELISKGIIESESQFDSYWTQLVDQKEEELMKAGFQNIIPLKHHVNDFALKKIQTKNFLNSKKANVKKEPTSLKKKFYSEVRLTNADKSVVGIVDQIIETDDGCTILDFKSGKIYSDIMSDNAIVVQAIKKDFEIQLKLYAQLFYLKTGQYPKALFVVSLSNSFVQVEFTHEECELIYSEVISFLREINKVIESGELIKLANPTEANCRFCLCRPACKFYLKWLPENYMLTNDLCGEVERINQFANNTVGMQILLHGQRVLINGLISEQKNELEALIGKKVNIYNLKKSKNTLNAMFNDYSAIYAS